MISWWSEKKCIVSLFLTNALSYFAPNPPNVKRHAYERNMSIVVPVSFPASYEIEEFSACFLKPQDARKGPFFDQKDAVSRVRRSVLRGRKKPSRFIEKRSRFIEERSRWLENTFDPVFLPPYFLVCTFSEYLFLTNFLYNNASSFQSRSWGEKRKTQKAMIAYGLK